MVRTNSICRSVAKRSANLGTFGHCRNSAFPLRKDVLGLADQSSEAIATDDSLMSATFVVSTMVQDRDGDIVLPQGFKLDNFRRNPVWFYSHQAIIIPIGTAEHPQTRQLHVTIEPDKRVLATCFFDPEDPDAVFLYGKVMRRILRATSIGFMPLQGERIPAKANSDHTNELPGWFFNAIDLLEISIVGVPANQEAMRIEAGDRVSTALRKSIELMTPRRSTVVVPSTLTISRNPAKIACCEETRMGSHFIEKCSCGAVIAQCRCFGEKTEIITDKGCDKCRKEATPASGGPLPNSTNGDLPGREIQEGSDIQSVQLSKKGYPTKEVAAKWVEEHDLETDEFSETTEFWVFTQFEAALCRPSSQGQRELAPGVICYVCQRFIEEESGAQSGAENPQEGKMAKLVNGKIVKEDQPADPDHDGMSHGKAFAHKSADLMRQYYDLMEHPEMTKCMSKMCKALRTHAMKAYPDEFEEKDFPSTEGENPEPPEEPDDEEGGKAVKLLLGVLPANHKQIKQLKAAIALLAGNRAKRRKAVTDPESGLDPTAGGEVDPVDEAARYLEDHAEVHKGDKPPIDHYACKYHAMRLKAMLIEDPGDEGAGGETEENEKFLKEVRQLRKEFRERVLGRID